MGSYVVEIGIPRNEMGSHHTKTHTFASNIQIRMSTAHAMMQHTIRFPRSDTKVMQESNLFTSGIKTLVLIFPFQSIINFSLRRSIILPSSLERKNKKQSTKTKRKMELHGTEAFISWWKRNTARALSLPSAEEETRPRNS